MAVKMMNSMRSSPLKTAVFIVIGVISLLGQGLAFAPTKFNFLLQILPAWGNLTFGMGLCLTSLIAFAVIFRLWNLGNFTNWTLLTIQAISVFGIFLLLDGFASHLPETSFLFTAALTTLTIVGIFININDAPVHIRTDELTLAEETAELEVSEE